MVPEVDLEADQLPEYTLSMTKTGGGASAVLFELRRIRRDIAARGFSPFSSMPPGLLNMLTKEEVLDLLAYLESGTKPGAKKQP